MIDCVVTSANRELEVASTAFIIGQPTNSMGNQNSSNPMAISAMAHMMKLTRMKLFMLRDHCVAVSEKADTPSGYQISRGTFLASMGVVQLPTEPDYEVLEKLLVLWDKNGTNRIDPVS